MTPNIHSQCVTPLSKAWVVLAVAPVKVRVRDERRDDLHFGLLVLGGCLILFRRLQT